MSLDFSYESPNLPQDLSLDHFETYANNLGFDLQAHPKSNIITSSGYFPFRIQGNNVFTNSVNKFYITGFEYYSSHEDNLFSFTCHCQGALEILIANIFISYFLSNDAKSVAIDHYTGKKITKLNDLLIIIKKMQQQAKNDFIQKTLPLYEFEGW